MNTVYIRQYNTESWGIMWPQPGWTPCPPECKMCKKGKHDKQPYWAGHTRFPTRVAAVEFAHGVGIPLDGIKLWKGRK